MCEHEEVYKLEAFKLFNTILKPYGIKCRHWKT